MEQIPENNFEFEKSVIAEAYKLLGATTPLELNKLYVEEDQKLMHNGDWEYDNPELVINKVKEILENCDKAGLTEEENDWRKEILWFWYHHAVSCAIRHKDRVKAEQYVIKALFFQGDDHPNQITKLLKLLIDDNLPEAEDWAKNISNDVEKDTAQFLIDEYKKEGFF